MRPLVQEIRSFPTVNPASVLASLPGDAWVGSIKRDDVWVGALGALLMLIVLWVIVRDASESPPRDHPR
jgi:hypothetical protein